MAAQDWLELGRIGSPYGIKGWVHVQSFTDPPQALLKYRAWTLQAERAGPTVMNVVEARAQGSGLVARLEGIEDRDRAAKLQGAVIRIERSVMPKLRKREFYQADLIGLSVSNVEGTALGRIAHFIETPGGTVMVVRADTGKEHWVPATREHLMKVDVVCGQVVVEWPQEMLDESPDPSAGGDGAESDQAPPE